MLNILFNILLIFIIIYLFFKIIHELKETFYLLSQFFHKIAHVGGVPSVEIPEDETPSTPPFFDIDGFNKRVDDMKFDLDSFDGELFDLMNNRVTEESGTEIITDSAEIGLERKYHI
jgi:hypothetical protein